MLLLTIREALACAARFSVGVIQDESALRVGEDRPGCSGKMGFHGARVRVGSSSLVTSAPGLVAALLFSCFFFPFLVFATRSGGSGEKNLSPQ